MGGWQYQPSGFTTAWPPNKVTPGQFGGMSVPDTDLIAIREENGGPTFAAVTARSFHPGGVNALMGDGSVRFIKSTIDGRTWRAWGPWRVAKSSVPIPTDAAPLLRGYRPLRGLAH